MVLGGTKVASRLAIANGGTKEDVRVPEYEKSKIWVLHVRALNRRAWQGPEAENPKDSERRWGLGAGAAHQWH